MAVWTVGYLLRQMRRNMQQLGVTAAGLDAVAEMTTADWASLITSVGGVKGAEFLNW